MKKPANHKMPPRRYRMVEADSMEEIAERLVDVSLRFCLFLAVDASGLTSESILAAATKLLARGAVYICVWGTDCERVHDCFDEECLQIESKLESETDVIMTTWHTKDSLAEALWFFTTCVEPTYGFRDGCIDWVAVSVGNKKWGQAIRQKLLLKR